MDDESEITPQDHGDLRAPNRAREFLPSLGRVNSEIADAILRKVGGAEKLAEHLNTIIEDAVMTTKAGVCIDYKARLSALQLALHYIVGRPIERQQILTANVNTEESEAALAERIANSPALRDTLRRLLDKNPA